MSICEKSLHWADKVAHKIIKECADCDQYTCASGITPSGTVHIGNFREIISVDLVVRALRDQGKSVRFVHSWDDYDVFRRIPDNVPAQDELKQYIRMPITSVPDPFQQEDSYARHHEREIESALPEVGIYPEYVYQSKQYQAGVYAQEIKIALDNRHRIQAILNEYRDEQHKISGTYWPVSVFCTACHKDCTTVDAWDSHWCLQYHCECGHGEQVDLRQTSAVKLSWRVDWAMRWSKEHVVFEPAGKDHHSQGGSFDTARLISDHIYHWPAPVSFRYDFIGLKGLPGKMSSSAGKVVGLRDVLEVYQPEVLRYLFVSTRPNTEFSISFDLDVLKIYEDYDKSERVAWGIHAAKSEHEFMRHKRIYELSQVRGMPPCISYQVPFRHVCNILQINSGDISAVLAFFSDIHKDQIERFEIGRAHV